MSAASIHARLESTVTVPTFPAGKATIDPSVLDRISEARPVAFCVVALNVNSEERAAIRVLAHSEAAPLARLLSLLDGFGLAIADIRTWAIERERGARLLVRDFVLDDVAACQIDTASWGNLLGEALDAAWGGEDETDEFSPLVTHVGISRRDAGVLRTYTRYLHQIRYPIGTARIAECLVTNAAQARALIAYFHLRFDPERARGREAAMAEAEAALERGALAAATNDDARVLRRLAALMRATLRVSFFQKGERGEAKPCLAMKFDSSMIDDLPLPRPMFEIFVSGARVEGIHLRGGRVARGGLRWSDRPQDFRTEILGLLKAQMVKNVVIVPAGSKGGFVVRRQARLEAAAMRDEGIACYRLFIDALLDLTDNLVDGQIVPPPDVVRYDGDDPYLVVAADKGTATFSDLANELAARRGFWLGDAFASGGSTGYDHKAMGITARGAWESVRRHFAEMGRNIDTNVISAVGVGDMSGDVFGNGMLLSRNIRLVAAFDHRHVFIDPEPRPTASYTERKRLFEQPGSSWSEYNPDALSCDGGIFARSARSITVSEAARACLGLASCETTPDELIRSILCADVDLLWLGGIGTYIKGSSESQESVGDRANDAVRVDGSELRCRVIGEGANLGLTQAGRVEYALAGGRINTDAIDNAGGVNCSDHEVNIKILLNRVESAGRITRAERNALLRDMTDEVAELVLSDNRMQALALSLAVARAPQTLERHVRLIRRFEREGQLNRSVAGLPDEETLSERGARGLGLSRPELAVLLAHTKISIYAELIKSDLPDDPLFEADLLRYFPRPMQERFRDDILAHPLRREIIATVVVNSMVNRIGSGFVNEMQDRTGASDADIARAYAVARDLSEANRIWDAVAGVGGGLDAAAGIDILVGTRDAVEAMAYWLLRNVSWPISVSDTVQRFMPAIACFRRWEAARIEREQTGSKAPANERELLLCQVALLPRLGMALDIARIAETTAVELDAVCRCMVHADERLGVTRVLDRLTDVRGQDAMELRVLAGVREDVGGSLRDVVTAGLRRHANAVPAQWPVDEPRLARFAATASAYVEGPDASVMSAVVCSQELRALAGLGG